MNPIDKYLEKRASGWKETATNAAVGAATVGALSTGAAAISFGAKSLYDAVTKRRDFRNMLDNNPDLHEKLQNDPKMFNQAYSSLRSVNMQFAKEPLIAGNYMRQIMESPMMAGGKIELALLGGQGNQTPIDKVTGHMFEGARAGMSQPHADPHADLAHQNKGMEHQLHNEDLKHKLYSNNMRQAVDQAKLERSWAHEQAPIMSPIKPGKASEKKQPGGGSSGPQRPGMQQQLWAESQQKNKGERAPQGQQRLFG